MYWIAIILTAVVLSVYCLLILVYRQWFLRLPLFSIPKATVLKDLVFSVQNAEESPDGGTDVRIALAQ